MFILYKAYPKVIHITQPSQQSVSEHCYHPQFTDGENWGTYK